MAEEAKVTRVIEDNRLPMSAKYATVARTSSVLFKSLSGDQEGSSVEFRRMERTTLGGDVWKVLHFTLYTLDGEDKMKVTTQKEGINFAQALDLLVSFENGSRAQENTNKQIVDLDSDKFPFLKNEFFTVEHFMAVAEREGVVFDQNGTPHVKGNDGRIVSDGVFKVADIESARAAYSGAAMTPGDAINTLEKGVLMELFDKASAKGDFNATLTGFNALGHMDGVVSTIQCYSYCMRAFLDERIDVEAEIRGKSEKLSRQEENDIRGFFAQLTSSSKDQLIASSLQYLAAANDCVNKIEKVGVHAEPYRKFVAHCELATHVIRAQVAMNAVKKSRGDNTPMIEQIRDDVAKAEQKFRKIGATNGEVELLKAAVLKDTQPVMPAVVKDFISRYKSGRESIVKKLEARQKAANDPGALLTAKNKPAAGSKATP